MHILTRHRVLILGWGLIFFVSGCATNDFRGVALPSRAHAQTLAQRGIQEDDFKGLRGGQVRATANIEYVLGEISSFWITISNDSSSKPINIDYRFSEFFLVTNDGEKRPLIIPEAYLFPSPRGIPPRNSATLQVRLGRPKVVREEIKMIECSFDLGKVRVFLFPSSQEYLKRHKSFLASLFW